MNPAFDIVQAKKDDGFRAFVDEVNPRDSDGIQKVWISEAFLIIKILWELYNVLKELGWFSALFAKWRIKKAMKLPTEIQREAALNAVKAIYKK